MNEALKEEFAAILRAYVDDLDRARKGSIEAQRAARANAMEDAFRCLLEALVDI